jgi:hypothetical protein
MAIDKKISNLIDSQFPDFILEEGPNLVAFVKAYYEWLETSDQAVHENRKLLDYQDVDTTLDEYLRFFQNEIMDTIPKSVLADKRLLLKNIKDIYTSKGSQKSYELLFRILYGQDIDFFYPGQVILRASDGRWVKEQSLNAIIISGIPSNLDSTTITGQTSGATARVESTVTIISSGIETTEVLLTSVVGTFVSGETITNSDGNVVAEVFSTIGPLQDVSLVYGGIGHIVGDNIAVTSPTGFGATGTVAATSDTSAIEAQIQNGGSGYTTSAVITFTGGSPTTPASANVASLSNTSILPIMLDTIQPMAPVVLNTGPTFISLGANTATVSANLASANISSVLASSFNFVNTTIGTIASITMNNYGFGYQSLPTITVTDPFTSPLNIPDPGEPGDFFGQDGLLAAAFVDGAITDVTIPDGQRGTGYRTFDLATITNSTRVATNAQGNPVVTGVIDKPGRYTDTRGFLSGDNVLQDNFFYQEYSYVIKSRQFIDTYRKVVTNVLHPAGVKLFGEYQINNTINVRASADPVVITSQLDQISANVVTFDATGGFWDSTTNTFDETV